MNRGVPTRYMFGTCIGWPAALTTSRKLRPQAKQWNAAGTLRAHPGDHFGAWQLPSLGTWDIRLRLPTICHQEAP